MAAAERRRPRRCTRSALSAQGLRQGQSRGGEGVVPNARAEEGRILFAATDDARKGVSASWLGDSLLTLTKFMYAFGVHLVPLKDTGLLQKNALGGTTTLNYPALN